VATSVDSYVKLEPGATDEQAPVRAAYRYIENRPTNSTIKQRLLPTYRLSGEIESAHRYVILERLDIAGAWWTVEETAELLSLQVLRENHLWNDYWTNLTPLAA